MYCGWRLDWAGTLRLVVPKGARYLEIAKVDWLRGEALKMTKLVWVKK
jgi:hypothetical protein